MNLSDIRATHLPKIGDRVLVTRKDGQQFLITKESDQEGPFYRAQHDTVKETTFPLSSSLYSATSPSLRQIIREINAATPPNEANAMITNEKEVLTFAQFVATRVANTDNTEWAYTDEYNHDYTIKFDGETYFATDDSEWYTLETAEANSYAHIYLSPETQLFYDFQKKFGDYDDIPNPVKGFDDSSWGNDSCPSVSINLTGYVIQLFMDYRKVESREIKDGEQFSIICAADVGETFFDESFDSVPEGLAQRCLTTVYTHWLNAHGMGDAGCATELLMTNGTDSHQMGEEEREWVREFVEAWERTE